MVALYPLLPQFGLVLAAGNKQISPVSDFQETGSSQQDRVPDLIRASLEKNLVRLKELHIRTPDI